MQCLTENIVISLNFFKRSPKMKTKDQTKFLRCSLETCVNKNTLFSEGITKLEYHKILIGREFTNSDF